jgi:hypothetical protein
VQALLKQFRTNFILLSYGDLTPKAKADFESFTSVMNDGRILLKPTSNVVKELFMQISNYQFKATPLILETFN